MNTVISDSAKQGLYLDYDVHHNIALLIESTSKKQDAHTRLELAKAVREIDNPYKQPLSRFSDNTRLTMGKRKGFDEALQAVLKVMEGTK
jgi:hypothetical protein